MRKLIILFILSISFIFAKTTIPQKEYKLLQKAQKLEKEKNYASAINIYKQLSTNKVKIVKTYGLQGLANVYTKKRDFKNMIFYYKKIINSNLLKRKQSDKMKLTLSQIYLKNNNYKASLTYALRLLKSPYVNKKDLNENIALAYYYSKQYSKSASYIRKAIAKTSNKKQWRQMLFSAYIESKNYNAAAKSLKNMIAYDSRNSSYWLQLVSLYQMSKNYKKALATLELAYKKNIIKKKDNLMFLVNILLQNRIYNKAALLLEEGIKKAYVKNSKKNFDLLISAFYNAKNYKKTIYHLKSSSFAKNEKYQLLLGSILYSENKYNQAIKTLSSFKFKSQSRNDGKKYTILALSAYELNQKEKTINYLKKASNNKYVKQRAINIAQSLGLKI